MAAEQVKKARGFSMKSMFGIAAGLVFVCQLAAMVLVVQGQVEKAQHRDARPEPAHAALADCAKKPANRQRGPCAGQVQAAAYPYSVFEDAPDHAHAVSPVAAARDAAGAANQEQGVMQAMLSSLR